MGVFDGQMGIAKEVTWGTAVTPVTRFYDVKKATLEPVSSTISASGIRAGRSSTSIDQMQRTQLGSQVDFDVVPLTKGFGLLLQLALGSVSLGAVVGGKTPQTHTVASTAGVSFTNQLHLPHQTAAGGYTATIPGSKIDSFTLGAEVGSELMSSFSVVGKPWATGTAKSTASYPSGAEVFAWDKMTVTIAGATVCGSSWEFGWENQLKSVDDATKFCGLSEPISTSLLDGGTFSLSGVNLETSTHLDRILAAIGSGVQIIVTCTGTADTAATLTITMPACVAEGDFPGLDEGSLDIEQDLKFRITTPAAGGSPVTIVYNSTDVAA